MGMSDKARRLRELGIALYGERWQQPTAKALKINSSAIWRYLNEGSEPSDERIARMKELARERINELTKAIGGG